MKNIHSRGFVWFLKENLKLTNYRFYFKKKTELLSATVVVFKEI